LSPITVTAAAPTQLVVGLSTTNPTASTAANETISVTVEDSFGNPVAGFTDTVNLTDSVPVGNTIGALSGFNASGVATASATLQTAGLQTITAHDSTS